MLINTTEVTTAVHFSNLVYPFLKPGCLDPCEGAGADSHLSQPKAVTAKFQLKLFSMALAAYTLNPSTTIMTVSVVPPHSQAVLVFYVSLETDGTSISFYIASHSDDEAAHR